ncbi:hypothetical protein [Prevotella melaninogenica]
MKKNLFSNHTLCAGLVLGGLFTFSSSYAANNEVKDNNNVVAAAPTTNSQIVGTWELTNKGSYAIVRNPRTHKEYKVGFTIDRYDDYKFLPVDFATGEPVNLRTLVGHDDNDLDDELHRFDFYHDGTMSVIEREDNGRWKRDDDIGVYGFRRDGFFMKIDGKMRKNLQIRFLNNNEFELTQTKFNDSDLRRVVVKKVMRYVRVTRK